MHFSVSNQFPVAFAVIEEGLVEEGDVLGEEKSDDEEEDEKVDEEEREEEERREGGQGDEAEEKEGKAIVKEIEVDTLSTSKH